MEWLPRAPAAAPAGAAGAWRLPARQHDPAPSEPSVLAVLDWELSTLGRPARRFHLSLMQWHMPHSDPVPAPARWSGMTSRRSAFRRCRDYVERLCGAHRARSAAASRGLSRPTISSAWRRSCRASSGACATAPRPARTRPPSAPDGAPARREGLGVRARRPVRRDEPRSEDLRARARRRRRAGACAYRGDRGAGRDGRAAGLRSPAPRSARVIGAGYAAGMSGKRDPPPMIALAHDRGEVLRRVMAARAVALVADACGAGFGNPLLLDAAKFCDAFLADRVPGRFRRAGDPAAADRHRPARARGDGLVRQGRSSRRSPPRWRSRAGAAGGDRRAACWSTAAWSIRCRSTACAARPM